MTLLLVGLGGGLGAMARYLAVNWIARTLGTDTAIGTATVNVMGSFLMGVLAIALLDRGLISFERYAPFLLVGVLGGFTTFSAFSADSVRLIEAGRVFEATGYIVLSVVLSLGALVAGLTLARATF